MSIRIKDIKQDITKKINEPLPNGTISSDEFDQWLDSMRPATEEEMSAVNKWLENNSEYTGIDLFED